MGRKFQQSQTARLTKRERIQQERLAAKAAGVPFTKPEKFVRSVARYEPKTENLRKGLRYFEDGYPILILTGSAGTGKSMLAAYCASKLLLDNTAKKIYLVRPAVGTGKTLGLLPGELDEKQAPYFVQIIEHLGKFLGPGHVQAYLNDGTIQMEPVEYLRGRSLENCVVIGEEVQNFTHDDFECVLTRLGENTRYILNGDTKQHDLHGESGLTSTLRLIETALQTHPEYMTHEEMDDLDDGIAVVKFTPNDVLRHGLTKALVRLYYHTS